MYTNAEIRNQVERFYRDHAPDGSLEDAFVPWWLTRKFSLPVQEAIASAPGGSHDYGLDGFYFEFGDGSPVLHLIQGKFSKDPALIKKGTPGLRSDDEGLAGHIFR